MLLSLMFRIHCTITKKFGLSDYHNCNGALDIVISRMKQYEMKTECLSLHVEKGAERGTKTHGYFLLSLLLFVLTGPQHMTVLASSSSSLSSDSSCPALFPPHGYPNGIHLIMLYTPAKVTLSTLTKSSPMHVLGTR